MARTYEYLPAGAIEPGDQDDLIAFHHLRLAEGSSLPIAFSPTPQFACSTSA